MHERNYCRLWLRLKKLACMQLVATFRTEVQYHLLHLFLSGSYLEKEIRKTCIKTKALSSEWSESTDKQRYSMIHCHARMHVQC